MRIIRALGVLLLVSGTSAQLHAYDADTHRAIARRSAQPEVSSVDAVLKTEFGMAGGIGEKVFKGTLQERTLEQLIGEGAFSEDDPVLRVLNHFHNPLLPWDQAGLTIGFQVGQSSVRWQQHANQNTSVVLIPPFFLPFPSLGGTWSWPIARMRFLDFLTLPNMADRDRALVEEAAS